MTAAPETPLNIQDTIIGKFVLHTFPGLYVQFANLSGPGNYYIHFPYSADLCRKSGFIKIHP